MLLIDNDSGAKGIYRIVKNITGLRPSGKEPFIHVFSNLYLVATPLKTGVNKSTIEDFFDASIKSTNINGKKFTAKEKFNLATHYGKTVFAHKVIRAQADKINFCGFNAILSNIVSVIDAHAKKFPLN